MKKRTAVALLLTLALLTTLLPAALAADWPDQLVDAGPWVNADESRTDELVYAMETGYGYEDFIIVYYNTQCGNSSLYVPQFYQLLQQAGSTLDVTVYGVNYEFAGIPFSLFEDYSVSFPTVVVFDADRGTYDAYKRVTSLSRFAEIIGVDMPDLELNQLLTDIPINPDLASMTSSPGLIARYTSGDVLPQEWEVLKLVNQERMAEGLQPLTTGYTLQQAAHARIEDLQLEYRPDHSRPNGAPCTEVAEALYLNERAVGENIARGQATAQDVVEDWMGSPGHRENILQPMFNHMGAGYGTVTGQNYSTVWEQFFIYHPCTYSGLTVTPSTIQVGLGQTLADQDVKVEATCTVHGTCQMPLIDAMCTGLDLSRTGTSQATVHYQGLTAPIQVQVVETPAWSQASDWALAELQGAQEAGLIPDLLWNADMTAQMSRQEFAAVAVTVYERLGGQLPADCPNPFVDVNDSDDFLLQAYALGIVTGTDATHFSPHNPVNREQAAVMLARALNALGEDTSGGSGSFTDAAAISDWARDSVVYMAAHGIIQGNQAGQFMPLSPLSREAALLMAARMYHSR